MFWIRRARPEESDSGRSHWGWTWTVAFVLSIPGLYRLVYRLLHPILNKDDVTGAAELATHMATTVVGVFGRFGILFLPLAVVGLWFLLRERQVAGRLLAAIAGLNLAGLLVLRLIHPLLKPRYLVALLPAVWMGAAAFVVFGPFGPRVRRVAFVVALAGMVANDLRPGRGKEFLVSEEIRALPQVAAPGDAIVYLPRFNYKIGSYYGLPPSPSLAEDVTAPTAAELDGRRVWLVSGTLPADRHVREARGLMEDLAQRRPGNMTNL